MEPCRVRCVGSGNSGLPIPEILSRFVFSGKVSSRLRWRVLPEGPSRWIKRPRSRTRSRMAAAISSSCRTFPHSFSGLLVVKMHRPLPEVPIVHHMIAGYVVRAL